MPSTYQKYLDHLGSIAETASLARQAEHSIYPLFADLKKLINHYSSTIASFTTILHELVNFMQRLEYQEDDFDYYQDKFLELRKIDNLLNDLKNKQAPSSVGNDKIAFITKVYSTASLYRLKETENQIYAFHNKIAEAKKQQDKQASNTKTIVIVVLVILFLIFLISMCN